MQSTVVILMAILVIGIILLSLIAVVNTDGGKIVLGSLGGVMILVSVFILFIRYKYPIPKDQEKNFDVVVPGAINTLTSINQVSNV